MVAVIDLKDEAGSARRPTRAHTRSRTVGGVLFRLLATLLLVVAAVTVYAVPATAHVAPAGSDISLAQTIAGMEMTVIVRRTDRVPGPLRVDVIPHTPVRAVSVDVTVRSAASAAVASGTVSLKRDVAQTYPVVLAVHDDGTHWLELRAGDEFTQLPFRVETAETAASERWASGLFAAVAVLLVSALGAATRARRTLAVVLGSGGAVALIVGTTVAAVSPITPAAGDRDAGAGRPYAQARITTEPARPAAGEAFALRLVLVDGSTGRLLDDLVPHHNALAHLVVTSSDGSAFHHLHPRRTTPGHLEVRLSTVQPGPYRVYAEIERENAGSQLVSGGFDVEGPAADVLPTKAVLPTTAPVVAGRPVGIEVDTGPDQVQSWLGMAGHLIVRNSGGGFLGHAHEAGSMDPGTPPPDDTVAAHDPRLRFAFTFPEPGRYFVWLQYSRRLSIVTVPFVIDVEAATT